MMVQSQSVVFDLSARTGPLFDVLTLSVPGFVWLANPSGDLEFVNKAWTEFTGLSLAESLGMGWRDALHSEDVEKVRTIWLRRAASAAPAHEIEVRFRRADGVYRWYRFRATPIGGGDESWMGFSVDIHEQVMAQRKDHAQIAILKMVASNAPVHAVLDALCRLGEEQLPGCRCTILLLNDEGTEFEAGAAAFLPAHMLALLSGIKIGPGVGSCGTAAYERRDVISADILSDPLWKDWRQLFEPLGVRACWSRPVYGADGKVLATYGFYFFEEKAPNEEELKSLDNLRHFASVAIGNARTTQALRESEEHYRHTVEHNPQIPWTADPMGRLLSVSSRWTEATGLSVASAMGNGWFNAVHPDDVQRTVDYWSDRLHTGAPADLKYRIRLQDGSFRWVRARAAPRRDDRGNIVRWYGAVEDIHELELATERLRRQVYHDDLTRLLNRRGLEEFLRTRLRVTTPGGLPISLLIVDIAGFRHVNDRFGHETGDAALRLFGRHLRACVEAGDVVARIAGDEFAIVFGQAIDEVRLQKQAGKLASELNRRMGRSSRTRNCTTSIGCARSESGEKAEDLLRRADLALYAAKRDPHAAVKLFTPAIRRTLDEKTQQIDDAKQALRARWIVPYYQPMVALASGKVAGAEALLRIAHPARGILSPAAIWAALDAPKVSKSINDRMLALTLADLASWKPWPLEAGSISINLSTEMMLQDGLARTILRKMERRGIDPRQLTVEVTERVLVDDLAPTTHRALSDLQRHGVRVSLDDFGTGFASLTHLQKLPVNEIKIDRSFIDGLAADGSNAAIVRSMISLGVNMGIDVVAEGVETAEQAGLLREWGCRFAQGFHFYKPMPASDFGLVLRGTRNDELRGEPPLCARRFQTAAVEAVTWV